MSKFISLSEPYIDNTDIKSVSKVIRKKWVSTAGKDIEVFEKLISDFTNSKYAIACINGTSALHISLKIAGVKSNDEVIIPTITFVAPVNSIIYNNATPIFMDVDDFYNINIPKTIDFIKNYTKFRNGYSYNIKTNKRISAIIVVHVWGNAVNIKPLISICKKANIKIIEDASESLGSKYKRKINNRNHTGTLGFMGCLSFNGNKIITTGGGGMILTNNLQRAKKARYLINQAKDDSVYFQHNEIGYNYRLTNLQAALGISQIKKIQIILNKKKKINNEYSKILSNCKNLELTKNPEYANNNNWLNVIKIKNAKNLDKYIKYFEKNKIQVRPVWQMNHTQKQFKNYQTYNIVNAYKLVKESLCLPSSYSLKISDILKITKILKRIT